MHEPLGSHDATKNSKRFSLVFGAVVLGAAAAMGIVACSDGGDGESLLNGTGAKGSVPGTVGTAGSNGPTGNGSGPTGNGSSDGGVDGVDSSPGAVAESLFRALEPDLTKTCGGTGGICHVTGAYQNNTTPAWLAAPDAYASVKAYPGIIVRDPYGSKLIIKGPHAGPAFTGTYTDLGNRVMTWLTAESNAITSAPIPTTDAVAVVAGANTIDISKGGTGVTGAKITFTAAVSGNILSLTNMKLVAPATTGLHVSHPIFVIVPASGAAVPDPVDSFSNLDQTTGAGITDDFGVGTLILTGWAATSKLEIEFTTLAAATVADAGTVGCKSLATFTANAVPAIQANTCLNCHKAGGSGFGSLDLSAIGTDNAAACVQALNKVDLTNKAKSDIIVAPTGGVAGHPYKNASANYSTMMLSWINNE